MNPVRLRHSAAVRVAALFTGLFAVTITVVFAALYFMIRSDLDDRQKEYVQEVQSALLGTARSGGFPSLSAAIAKKASSADEEDVVYLLVDDRDVFVAGNITAAPRFSGWQLLSWENLTFTGKSKPPEPGDSVLGTWADVSGGHLFVGNNDGDVLEARNMLLNSLGLALIVAVAAALAGGAFLGLRARRHIDAISQALDAASYGDLTVRLPYKPAGDELNHISGRINTTLDRLQSSIDSIRQVTTDIAHDLKSPIGRVKQRLQNASETAVTASEFKEAVDSTVGEIDKIVATFNALLSISQIEAGLKKQRFSTQSLQSILATVVDAYGAVAEDAGHALDCRLDVLGPAGVYGDKDLLVQMFANLIENAIRHCPPGSRISIAGDLAASGPLVRISDNGQGIPAEERQNVFRRLYRLEKSRTTPGSGLGLALVAAIADMHDAKIELHDNAPGLLVELQFPARARSPRAMAAE